MKAANEEAACRISSVSSQIRYLAWQHPRTHACHASRWPLAAPNMPVLYHLVALSMTIAALAGPDERCEDFKTQFEINWKYAKRLFTALNSMDTATEAIKGLTKRQAQDEFELELALEHDLR